MILPPVLTVVSVLVFRLLAAHSKAGLIAFTCLVGLTSGSNISLTTICVEQLCRAKNYGRYYATCYTIVSICCLIGIPIAGEIISSNDGSDWSLIVFVGVCYMGGFVALLVV